MTTNDESLKNHRYIRAFKLRIIELTTETLIEYEKAIKEELRLRRERADQLKAENDKRMEEIRRNRG